MTRNKGKPKAKQEAAETRLEKRLFGLGPTWWSVIFFVLLGSLGLLKDWSCSKEQSVPIYNIYMGGAELIRPGQSVKVPQGHERALDTVKAELDRGRLKAPLGVLNQIGVIEYWRGDYAVVGKLFRYVLNHAERTGDSRLVSSATSNLSVVYQHQGDYAQSLNLLLGRLPEVRKESDSLLLSVYYVNIGIAYYRMGKFILAERYFRQSLEIDSVRGDSSFLAVDLSNIGLTQEMAGNGDSALELQLKALDIDRRWGTDFAIANDLLNVGTAYHSLGKLTEAEDFYRQVVSASKGKYNVLLATAQYNIGILTARRGQCDSALVEFDRAEHTFRDMNEFYNLTHVLAKRSVCLEELGKYDSAYVLCSLSVAMARSQGIDSEGLFGSARLYRLDSLRRTAN